MSRKFVLFYSWYKNKWLAKVCIALKKYYMAFFLVEKWLVWSVCVFSTLSFAHFMALVILVVLFLSRVPESWLLPVNIIELFGKGKNAYTSVITLSTKSVEKNNFVFRRVTNNEDDNYESLRLNYSMEKKPIFRSYNPLTGGFLAPPNTIPWIVSLSFGYAILLNESEISGLGRKDRTRFVLTTCQCIRDSCSSSNQKYASAGSYFKDLHGYYKQTQKIVGSHKDAKCKRAYAGEPKIYELNDDIIFNDQVQPLHLAINESIYLQNRSLFTVKYDTDMTHAPLTLIPLQKSYLVWLNTSAKETPKQIKTKRPFQYRNEDIRDKEVACSPLVTCDEVADRWALLGLWHSWDDGETYSTISQHFNWMGEVLRGVMAGDWLHA